MYRKYFQLPQQFLKTVISSSQPILSNIICESNVPKRWAGHSKWQNIKSTKEAADQQKSITIQKFLPLITASAKQGGPDISLNSKLKSIVEEAKKANIPKAVIEKAIKLASTQVADKPYWTVFSGPKGVVLGLEVAFANKKHGALSTKLAQYTKKLNLKMEPYFSHLCNERGIIIVEPLENVENGYEKALEDAIEIGVEEVHERDDNCLIFECAPERLDSYAQQISKKGYTVHSATLELDFKELVKLQEDEIQDLQKVITTLQNTYEEVLRASYNIEAQ